MRDRFSRRVVRWLALLATVLAAGWILLGSGGSASAVEPSTASATATPGLAQLTQPLLGAVNTLGTLLAPLTPGAASPQATSAAAASDPATQDAGPASTAPTALLHPAGQLVTTVVAHALPARPALEAVSTTLSQTTSTLSQTTSTLAQTTSTITGTLDTTLTQAASALPSALPTDQLRATLASLAGSLDQLASSAGSTVGQALAPLKLAGTTTHTADSSTRTTQAGTPAHALAAASTAQPASGEHGFTVLALPLLLEKANTEGARTNSTTLVRTAQVSAPGLRARPVGHAASAAPVSAGLGGLLAPRDGVPPSSPAAQHTPPSPAPAGPDGSGHAHFALGVGALPTLLPMQEPTRSTPSRLPLSPTFPPGESPD